MLFSFTVVLLQPVMPFVDYYITQHHNEQISQIEKEYCGCGMEKSEKIAKIENNGDAYLRALIKRVCDQKEKEKPVVPLVQIPVFVRDLNSYQPQIFICPEQNYNHKISTFIIQPDINAYIADIFHPPALS